MSRRESSNLIIPTANQRSSVIQGAINNIIYILCVIHPGRYVSRVLNTPIMRINISITLTYYINAAYKDAFFYIQMIHRYSSCKSRYVSTDNGHVSKSITKDLHLLSV